MAKTNATRETQQQPQQRRARSFNRHQEHIHDLYKLSVASFKKNISYTDEVVIQEVEHTHFFHSVDSNGNTQTTSVPVGGHFHFMKVVKEATDSSPAEYECSVPMKWVLKKNEYGKKVKTAVPVSDFDKHTHDVHYLHSEKFTPQPMNELAQKWAMNSFMGKPPQPVDGIQG